MTDLVFVDTNVLVYRVDRTDPAKQEQAHGWIEALWSSRAGRLSWQVLTEYYNAVTRPSTGMDLSTARQMVRTYALWLPSGPTQSTYERAWSLQDRYSLSWWDALIVAAAAEGGCRYLLTEDMHAGAVMDGVTLISPFAARPADVFGPQDG